MSSKNGVSRPWFKPKWEEWTAAKAKKAIALTDKTSDPSDDTCFQRRLNWTYVLKLAEDMRSGNFQAGGDCIEFDSSGVCLNGRHRLYAIVESGATVMLLTARDVPRASMIGRDDGLKRSDSASLRIYGLEFASPHLCSAAKRMATGPASTKLIWTKTNLADYMTRNVEALQFSVNSMGYGGSAMKGICVAGVYAAVARAFYHVKHAKLKEFCEILKAGLYDCDKEVAKSVIALRGWLMRGGPSTTRTANMGGHHGAYVYRKTQRCIQAFAKGEILAKIHEESEDLFPLPAEKLPKAPPRMPIGRHNMKRQKALAGVPE